MFIYSNINNQCSKIKQPQKMSLTERTVLSYLNVGQFLRWMFESRIALIFDLDVSEGIICWLKYFLDFLDFILPFFLFPQIAVFLTAIFDSILCQFQTAIYQNNQKQQFINLSGLINYENSNSLHELFNFLNQNLCGSFNYYSYHILNGSISQQLSSLEGLADLVQSIPLIKLLFPNDEESCYTIKKLFGESKMKNDKKFTVCYVLSILSL